MDYADGSRSKSGSQPDTVPEPSKEGEPVVPMTSVQPEASDNLLEVLRGASIDEEYGD